MPRQAKRNQDIQAPAIPGAKQGTCITVRDQGPVRYLDSNALHESLEFPRSQYRKLAIILAIAIALSVAVVVAYNTSVMQDVSRTQALVNEAISRDVSLDLPVMKNYVGKSNEDMLKNFSKDGYVIYDNSNEEDRNVDGFDVFKIATDMDPDTAAAAYQQGIDTMSDVDQARYLAGSWRFIVSRANDVELRLRYADFDAVDAQSAIQYAMESQGFDDAKLTDIAEDTMGNKNLSGSFKSGKKTYEYTISTCDLSQVYEIEGAPDDAQFVGIKVTVAS
ncbi:MAG: hypothetical protein Q4D27_06985 [Coriobacteriia bacterium]|nr:hypothetical protein [Coriobacteriia bacterium]